MKHYMHNIKLKLKLIQVEIVIYIVLYNIKYINMNNSERYFIEV